VELAKSVGGVLAALRRRAREGGGWQVAVNLAAVCMWVQDLGRLADVSIVANPAVADWPVDVLGFSLGGYVAQRLVVAQPQLARRCGTCCGAAPRPQASPESRRGVIVG
jgi:pimeloyl-ACP methyl ester carboxylesterase